MGKKIIMRFPSLFKSNNDTRHVLWWQWPSCKHPNTLSFRATDEMFKTLNSVFYDPSDDVETPDTWFTNSSERASVSSESEECSGSGDQSLEMIIRGARSERLFFEPGGTSSVLVEVEEAAAGKAGEMLALPFKESVALAMDSEDPHDDFKRSMEEMVETHGLKDWDCLEELLGWYLKVNEEVNHGFIVGAFVDLLLGIASSSSSNDSTAFSSAASSLSSPSAPSSPVSQKENDGDHIMETTMQ